MSWFVLLKTMDKDVRNYTAKQSAKAVSNPIAGVSDGLLRLSRKIVTQCSFHVIEIALIVFVALHIQRVVPFAGFD